ncbi:beta-glucosidase/6-phospho-beta-glucosidase/beta-galactosidase [Pseudomonas duriflava]|uniref:Beta-glucosidase/6-phospho-beta-glucosidase/beta-galactosidase n=1 Tax=Pseudomonas duriflava TaxID=459528 RepID=A0A562Q7T1_9PSED|nr:beta-glucosidase [Pseudomonas duriflava]TWI52789.1 beta-glucosidase/6-phospho-beta-glucosidase/beta-galactosidase [Pseudomonas duriflava]
MHVPGTFNSFFLGGFECSTHRRFDGRRLDLIAATRHDRFAKTDYARLRSSGIQAARDGVRWHLIETRPGIYDWSSLLPQVQAAREEGVQIIWDLCHYGWPDDIDIWSPAFVDRFARFTSAVAAFMRNEGIEVPFYCPVNEISYWAWAGGDAGHFNPMAKRRGVELKVQLVRASIAAIEAIRSVAPKARFVQADPLINVVPASGRASDRNAAEEYRQSQFEAWDMLCGKEWPGLGGKPEYLDIVGLNYYSDNQWFNGGQTIYQGDPLYRPLQGMLAEVYTRYQRPLLIAETGAEGAARAPWLTYVSHEVRAAMLNNIPIEGMCLYPILDYPGWNDERCCEVGLYSYADEHGHRTLHTDLADELLRQQANFAEMAAGQSL